MPELILYGIPNCDTVKKARRWLDEHGVPYRFHDFRKDGLDISTLKTWLNHEEWEALVNRRSTTWRELPLAVTQNLDEARALDLMQQHPTLIKRPVLQSPTHVVVGFSPQQYQGLV
jgi:arsenate reductase